MTIEEAILLGITRIRLPGWADGAAALLTGHAVTFPGSVSLRRVSAVLRRSIPGQPLGPPIPVTFGGEIQRTAPLNHEAYAGRYLEAPAATDLTLTTPQRRQRQAARTLVQHVMGAGAGDLNRDLRVLLVAVDALLPAERVALRNFLLDQLTLA